MLTRKRHLLYPHSWVRSICCRLFGLVFGSLAAPAALAASCLAAPAAAHDLSVALCRQLEAPALEPVLTEQAWLLLPLCLLIVYVYLCLCLSRLLFFRVYLRFRMLIFFLLTIRFCATWCSWARL